MNDDLRERLHQLSSLAWEVKSRAAAMEELGAELAEVARVVANALEARLAPSPAPVPASASASASASAAPPPDPVAQPASKCDCAACSGCTDHAASFVRAAARVPRAGATVSPASETATAYDDVHPTNHEGDFVLLRGAR